MKFTAWFLLIIGVLLLAHWGFFLVTGQVDVLESAYHFDLHLVGVGVTAVLLLVAGVGLARRWQSAHDIALVALGMFFYSLIVSLGYLAQQGKIVWVAIFAGLHRHIPSPGAGCDL